MTSETGKQLPRLVAIEGPIGVGKRSLCHRLSESLGYELMLEDPATNPFLERFYQARRETAFQTQLHFLLGRARQVQELRQNDMFRTHLVTNFIIEKDQIYAEANLDSDEMELYRNIYSHLTIERLEPDLVIYLQAPASWLYDRISGDSTSIEMDYLEEVCDAYTRFFHFYDAAPLIIANVSNIDLENNDTDLEEFVRFIKTTNLGRHYYNPQATII